MMRVLYDEHAAALWRYALRLTGDQARAEDVVQETLLRAWRHPEVTDEVERSARAWLFTVARNLIIDERRSARYRNESGHTRPRAGRRPRRTRRGGLRIGPIAAGHGLEPAVRGTSRGDPPVVLPGMDYRTDRQRSSDRGGHGEIPASLRGSGVAAQFAGNGGDAMTQFGFPLGGDLVDGDRYVTWDAAYVLGSLTSNERREYEAHLETCARCRSAVAEISGIPALLAMLDLEDVRALDEETPETPPLRPEVLESVLDKVRWRRRRSRWLTSAAVGVAAALLAVGVVIAIVPRSWVWRTPRRRKPSRRWRWPRFRRRRSMRRSH